MNKLDAFIESVLPQDMEAAVKQVLDLKPEDRASFDGLLKDYARTFLDIIHVPEALEVFYGTMLQQLVQNEDNFKHQEKRI